MSKTGLNISRESARPGVELFSGIWTIFLMGRTPDIIRELGMPGVELLPGDWARWGRTPEIITELER